MIYFLLVLGTLNIILGVSGPDSIYPKNLRYFLRIVFTATGVLFVAAATTSIIRGQL